jgi:predicted P-loop ATPase
MTEPLPVPSAASSEPAAAPSGEIMVIWSPALNPENGDPLYAAPLSAVLSGSSLDAYPDACIMPYVCSPPRRLGVADAGSPDVRIIACLVDVDGPAKKQPGSPDQDAWLDRQVELAASLPAAAIPAPIMWMTRSGLRLYWLLEPGTVTPADYNARCAAFLDQLRTHGFTGIDATSAQWWRMQRVPHGDPALFPPGDVQYLELPPAPAGTSPAVAPHVGTAEDSLLVRMLDAAGYAIGEVRGDKQFVECPWDEEHTEHGTPGYDPMSGRAAVLGANPGAFKCQHAHCAERGTPEVMALLRENPAAAAILAEHDRAREAAAAGLLESVDATAGAVTPGNELADWNFRVQRKEGGAIVASSATLDATFEFHPEWRGVFGFDELANSIVVRREPPVPGLPKVGARWTADDTHAILVWLNQRLRVQPDEKHIIAAVRNVARRSGSFHPVREYLRGLAWDGIPRDLCAYLGVDPSDYARAVCTSLVRSAVARVMRPGCKVDTLVILEGPQGRGKSTAVRTLFGHDWFYEAAGNAKDKDFAQDMRGKWAAEIPEVDVMFRGKDDSALKALISKQVDRYRPSHGRDSQDFPRQVVFVGTTNKTSYLHDETGNRRYLPLECGQIDLQALERDRDQVWAQAVAEYDADEPWWLSPEIEWNAAVEQQAERLVRDVWEDDTALGEWLAKRTEVFSTLDALHALAGAKTAVADVNKAHEMRMSAVLRSLGYESRKHGPKRVSRWQTPQRWEALAALVSAEFGETSRH